MPPTGVPTLSGACRARALVSDVPPLLDHFVEDGEKRQWLWAERSVFEDLEKAPRQATGGNAADAGLRAGDPDLCLTELVDTAPQSADGTGKKNPEPDQETLCGDGFAVNRQRILTIAATRVVVRKVAAVRLAHGERAII